MKLKQSALSTLIIVSLLNAGCSSYRTSSNIDAPIPAANMDKKVIISEDSLPGKKYTSIGPIEVSIKKLTAFNQDPTKEQANAVLMEKARAIGADAVINVTYKSGIGMTTWGYMDANGTGVKLEN